jgi:hypothetical protein
MISFDTPYTYISWRTLQRCQYLKGRILGRLVNHELEIICRGAVKTLIEALSRNVIGESEENNEKRPSAWPMSRSTPPEIRSRTLPLR